MTKRQIDICLIRLASLLFFAMKASPPISLCLSSVSEKLYRKKGHTELILVIVLLFLLHAIIFMTLVLMQLLFRCTGTVPFFFYFSSASIWFFLRIAKPANRISTVMRFDMRP